MSSHVVKASQVQKTEHHLLLVSTEQMTMTDITPYQARESVLRSCERTSRSSLAKGKVKFQIQDSTHFKKDTNKYQIFLSEKHKYCNRSETGYMEKEQSAAQSLQVHLRRWISSVRVQS